MNVVKDLLTVIIVGDAKNIPAQLVITGEETMVQKTGSRYVSQWFQPSGITINVSKIFLDFVKSWMVKVEGRERDSTDRKSVV